MHTDQRHADQRHGDSLDEEYQTASSDEWRKYAAEGRQQIRDIVSDNAGRSVLVAMTAGLGAGVLLGLAFGGSRNSSRWFNKATADKFGRSLLDKLESSVPSAVNDYLQR